MAVILRQMAYMQLVIVTTRSAYMFLCSICFNGRYFESHSLFRVRSCDDSKSLYVQFVLMTFISSWTAYMDGHW